MWLTIQILNIIIHVSGFQKKNKNKIQTIINLFNYYKIKVKLSEVNINQCSCLSKHSIVTHIV